MATEEQGSSCYADFKVTVVLVLTIRPLRISDTSDCIFRTTTINFR